MYGCKSHTIHKKAEQRLKNWRFWPAVLEKTWEPLEQQVDQTLNPKGNQPWIFIGRTNAEAPILWLPDAKSQLNGKDLDAAKDWDKRRRERQRMRWLDGISDPRDMNLGELWEAVRDRQSRYAVVHGVAKSRTRLSDRTATTTTGIILYFENLAKLRRVFKKSPSYIVLGWKVKVEVTQSCPTLCDPMNYTVHGILQAGVPEWVAFPFSRGSSPPRDQTQVSHIAGGFLTSWATREAQVLG